VSFSCICLANWCIFAWNFSAFGNKSATIQHYGQLFPECKAALSAAGMNFRFETQDTDGRMHTMKLSLKVEYACQVLAQLGYTHKTPELPHIENLAKAEAIPSNYLVQILNDLRTAGLITSKRGKQGGYALARDPGDITLHDIMKAVEGEILAHRPAGTGFSSERASAVWSEVAGSFEGILRNHTVADVMSPETEDMWYI
jgi:Rrf2 family protein